MNRYSRNSYPILPIGMVNMLTGANKEFGNVFNCWEEDENETYLLVSIQKQEWNPMRCKTMFRAVITCDKMESVAEYHKIGSRIELFHDQTGARFGDGSWTVEGLFSNTKEGLKKMAEHCGKQSIAFSTFK